MSGDQSMDNELEEYIKKNSPKLTGRLLLRPSIDNPFVIDNYPYGGKRCRVLHYLESAQTKSDICSKDRIISRTTPKWWNQDYTKVLNSLGRNAAEILPVLDIIRWNTPKKSCFSTFAYIIIDVKRRPPDIWTEICGLTWYGMIEAWWNIYKKYYWYMDLMDQEKFYKCIDFLTKQRHHEVKEFFSRSPEDSDTVPWLVEPSKKWIQ